MSFPADISIWQRLLGKRRDQVSNETLLPRLTRTWSESGNGEGKRHIVKLRVEVYRALEAYLGIAWTRRGSLVRLLQAEGITQPLPA